MKRHPLLVLAAALAVLPLIGASLHAHVSGPGFAVSPTSTRVWQVQQVLPRGVASPAVAHVYGAKGTAYTVYLSLDGTKANSIAYLHDSLDWSTLPGTATRVGLSWAPVWVPNRPRKLYVCTESNIPVKFWFTTQ